MQKEKKKSEIGGGLLFFWFIGQFVGLLVCWFVVSCFGEEEEEEGEAEEERDC